MNRNIVIFVLVIFSSFANGHGGKLDQNGGHYNNKTGTYHCHSEGCEDESGVEKGGDSNCDYPESLQIIFVNIGQGDAIIVATPEKILLTDSGETNWKSNSDALKIEKVIKSNFGNDCKTIDYFINSHLHLDHLGYIHASYNEQKQLLNANNKILKDGDTLKEPKFLGGIAHL